MSQLHKNNQRPSSFLDLIWRYKFYLVFYAICISFLSFALLYLIGGVPEELRVLDAEKPAPAVVATIDGTSQATTTSAASSTPLKNLPSTGKKLAYSYGPEYPTHVLIDKIGVDTAVSNPLSTDNTALNNDLLRGAVRYPGSGILGHGNMFIFAHNTGIKIVNNQAYKAFNHLKNLTGGDTIRVQSNDKEYMYAVTKVTLVDSNQSWVTFSDTKNMLTLSTCDVFGQKQDRYVVEAIFVKSTPL
jgi:LPXTG-site transpeptidase (sortase) family protein